jgi:molybdenum transport protein
LALAAVLNGGGVVHRCGASETVLLFANHRRFLDFNETGESWKKLVDDLRREAPEKKIIIEADSQKEALLALAAGPDVLQLDKFSPQEVEDVVREAESSKSRCLISAAGGVDRDNAAAYAEAGARFIVSSAPYYARPIDVKVLLGPA